MTTNTAGGEFTFGRTQHQSSSPLKNRGVNSKLFTEGSLHKQMVSFQSARGKVFNDASILKNSINQV